MFQGILSGKTRVLDLSYAIDENLVAWPTDERWFHAQVSASFGKDGYFTRSFWMLEHYGTHLDAPVHFALGGAAVDEIPPKYLFGPAVVLDVQVHAASDQDYQAPAKLLDDWELRHGAISEGAIVLLRTGWASRWPDAQHYRNQDLSDKMHFPGFSVEAAERCIDRKVSGLGCDTMSVDFGASDDFPVHHLAFRAGLYHLENLSDFSALPEFGAFLIVAPIKLRGGSGGPVRVFALLS
jgi:kynurenine formamidase